MLIENISSYKEFENYISKNRLIIVNISAIWCKPCMILKPLIEEYLLGINNTEFIYLKLDNSIYDEEEEFSKFFNLKKIPYFCIIKDGNIIESFVSSDYQYVSKKIEEHVSKEQTFDNFDINNDF